MVKKEGGFYWQGIGTKKVISTKLEFSNCKYVIHSVDVRKK